MESWHSTKINRYLAIKTIIESNGWSVEFFAVKVCFVLLKKTRFQ